MANNTNLYLASRAKKDKFYTQLSDIERELYFYKDFFKDKVVLCNCDDPFESWFFKYFASQFNALGLKKLITTSYADSPIAGTEILLDFGDIDRGKKAFIFEVDELRDWNGDGREDIIDVEDAIKSGRYKRTELIGDENFCAGDFRSAECVELLKQADVVVTNPPFSVFREFVAQLIKFDKKFSIIGNKNAITYKEIFPLIMNNKVWLGITPMSKEIYFNVPQEYIDDALAENKNRSVILMGGVYVARSQSIWFTNLDNRKRHEDIPLFREYSPEKYPKYDNYDAIEVSKTADIPCDYYGVMGVPITFLDKYNPAQFEILDARNFTSKEKLKKKNTALIKDADGTINGKAMYARILIKRRIT